MTTEHGSINHSHSTRTFLNSPHSAINSRSPCRVQGMRRAEELSVPDPLILLKRSGSQTTSRPHSGETGTSTCPPKNRSAPASEVAQKRFPNRSHRLSQIPNQQNWRTLRCHRHRIHPSLRKLRFRNALRWTGNVKVMVPKVLNDHTRPEIRDNQCKRRWQTAGFAFAAVWIGIQMLRTEAERADDMQSIRIFGSHKNLISIVLTTPRREIVL